MDHIYYDFFSCETYPNKTHEETYMQSYIATQRRDCINVIYNMCEHVEGILWKWIFGTLSYYSYNQTNEMH